MKKQNARTLSLIVCTFTYLLIGAAIFDSIESEEERRQKEAIYKLEEQMLQKYNISRKDFALLEEVIQLYKPFKAGMPWKFAGAFYYATTVLTTIGYGHSTPKTDAAKLFTMIYAMIGIPLGLVMFNSIGERLNNFSSIVINKIRRALNAKQKDTTEMDLICFVTTLSAFVTTFGAAAFSHYEGWSYFDSIYYCFVTLTTIGFGDLVALQQDNALQNKPEYVAFALLFIMFGLAIIAAWLNLMVLKFMTMNTQDEKRDEKQAIEAAAQTVCVDGDVIFQHNNITHWQVDGRISTEDLNSVCSCNTCPCIPLKSCIFNLQDETTSRNKSAIYATSFGIDEFEEQTPSLIPSDTPRMIFSNSHNCLIPKAESVDDLRSSTLALKNYRNQPRRPSSRRFFDDCINIDDNDVEMVSLNQVHKKRIVNSNNSNIKIQDDIQDVLVNTKIETQYHHYSSSRSFLDPNSNGLQSSSSCFVPR